MAEPNFLKKLVRHDTIPDLKIQSSTPLNTVFTPLPPSRSVFRMIISGRSLGPVATRVLTTPIHDNRMRTPTSAPVLPLLPKQLALYYPIIHFLNETFS
jgi:hypothetical protein